jgi:cysteinyl-tRNA synthetase
MGDDPVSGFKGLRLHNTLTREKQDFLPIDAGNVRVYVCGPTVYDDAHIGNARPAIVFDVLYRLLRHLYGADHVTYVRNITDVDDKIIDRARRDFPEMPLNGAIAKVTAETEARYHADVKALGCLEPTVEPRATEHIAEMVAMIRTLIEKNNAYEAEGHVLFDVKSWKSANGGAEYGKLSRRPLDEMIAGARVEVAPYKRDATDFVLWKPSSAEEPGWDSPWGRGRPGWHLECSAMSEKHLGTTFDIHGGGIDLVFPHHENEIAQSRCVHGTDVMANYWLHNGFLQVEGEKMAKSAGNFVTIHDLLHTDKFGGHNWPGEALRLAMLMTHYREPIDFSEARLHEASALRDSWQKAAAGHQQFDSRSAFEDALPDGFLDCLRDDLNTPEAIQIIQRHSAPHLANDGYSHRAVAATAGFLGLISDWLTYKDWRPITVTVSDDTISDLIAARSAARAEKNWAEADRIRDELDAMGIQVMDAKDPDTGELVTTWEVKR